jgi:hypothetical protein
MINALRVAALSAMIVVLLHAPAASGQDAYVEALGGLSWGATPDDVLAHHRERVMARYRLDIAGIRDPIAIDRLRRQAEQRVREMDESHERFDGQRTGYEVSVLQNELVVGTGMSMMTIRQDETVRQYVFVDDALRKMIVTFDQASLGYVGFEPFVNQLSAVLGGPSDTEWREDDIGVRQLVRAVWTDGETRIRAEDKSRMFASFIVVYGDASHADDASTVSADASPGGRANRPGASRDVGALMRRIDPGEDRPRDNTAIVDDLIGGPVEVELRVRSDEEVFNEDGERLDGAASALDEEDELEDVEQEERPRRAEPRRSEPETEPEDDDGGLIY